MGAQRPRMQAPAPRWRSGQRRLGKQRGLDLCVAGRPRLRQQVGESMDIARALQKAVGRLAGTTDDDYDDYDENDNETDAEREEHARCLRGAGGSQFDHIYDQQSAGQRRSSPETDRRTLALVRVERSEFAYLAPQSFAGARQIADRFRDDASVIVDLESCEAALAGRVTDFCSGLAYALGGSLQFIGERVLLLTPGHVELSGEEAVGARRSGFFNRL